MINIEFKQLSRMLLPTFLRQSRQLAWFNTWVMPCKLLLNDAQIFEQETQIDINRSPQVCYLRGMLKSLVDKKITLSEVSKANAQYIYRKDQDKTIWLDGASKNNPLLLYSLSQIGSEATDFVVNLPIEKTENEINSEKTDKEINNKINKINYYVNAYKLASMRFSVNVKKIIIA